MKIPGSTALVTGANRGLGRHFATQLLERGAARVYATARRRELVDIPGAQVLALDITDPASVAAAAAAASDVTLLINNAGVLTSSNLITGDLDDIRSEMETNCFGTLSVVRTFAPVLAASSGGAGGGAILNVLSVVSWLSSDGVNSYAATKAAQWSLTNGIRLELAEQGTLVTGLHLASPASTDTDLIADWDMDKNDPADVVRTALDGLEAGRLEVLADDESTRVKAGLALDPSALYPQTTPTA